jgi:hypothetical protein
MSHVDDFDVLVVEQGQGKDRIATVIETALHNVKHADTSEGYAGQALRLRGAAVLLQTAAIEVAALMGSFELAAKVSESGMLDQDEADHR